MPDALHWLGVTKIDRLVSMSDMKYNAITQSVRPAAMLPPPSPPRPPLTAGRHVFAGYRGGGAHPHPSRARACGACIRVR